MALKRQFPSMATFSMSSMTDVIFLLLIFFVVTSTVIFPAAIEVNLPQSSVQTDLKPVTEVYIDSLNAIYIVPDRNDSVNTDPIGPVAPDRLADELLAIRAQDSLRAVALYADKSVRYEKVVDVLDVAARNNLRMVLATRASQSAAGKNTGVEVPVMSGNSQQPKNE